MGYKGGNFYAGFELELAGAERPGNNLRPLAGEGVSIRQNGHRRGLGIPRQSAFLRAFQSPEVLKKLLGDLLCLLDGFPQLSALIRVLTSAEL